MMRRTCFKRQCTPLSYLDFFAARYPTRKRVMVIEEGPPEGHGTFEFVLDWRGLYSTLRASEQKIGERLAWSVAPSFRETAQGWTLGFDPADLVAIQKALNGDSWNEWLASTCPALVIRGTQSKAVDGTLLAAMAERRPKTRMVSLDARHVTHHDDARGFRSAVRAFLQELPDA